MKRVGDVRDVLVIDDERGFCQLVERMLKSSGSVCNVRHAYGGKGGLRAARLRRPDLLLLDLMMPDIDGFQVLEQIRRDPALAEVPVVLLTATSYVEDRLAQVVVRRLEGMRPAETLRCLGAVIEVLEPGHNDQAALDKARALPGTQAGRVGDSANVGLQNR
jgi:CheY-like chemotaxis protein